MKEELSLSKEEEGGVRRLLHSLESVRLRRVGTPPGVE